MRGNLCRAFTSRFSIRSAGIIQLLSKHHALNKRGVFTFMGNGAFAEPQTIKVLGCLHSVVDAVSDRFMKSRVGSVLESHLIELQRNECRGLKLQFIL